MFTALVSCKNTLKELLINDNKSLNRAVPQLQSFLTSCLNLEVLDISDSTLRTKGCQAVSQSIV